MQSSTNVQKKFHWLKSFSADDVRFYKKLGEGGFGAVRLATLEASSKSSSSMIIPEELKAEDSEDDASSTSTCTGTPLGSDDEYSFDKKPDCYAVKIISKYKVLSNNQQEHMYNELKYMSKLNHPFIVQLHSVQQDARNIYMLMDYMQHGELLKVINAKNRVKSNLARFYAAQVVLVFDYLHARDLIYRDLKPENLLLQSNGYIKMTDFGFVKRVKTNERTYTLCGTPEYMAPEVIQNSGHGRAADWYTLGIFLYELLVGQPPFMHNDPYKVFEMILTKPLPFPANLSSDAVSLIKHLTSHNLTKRYGNLINGSEDIKNHRFFRSINFGEVIKQKAEAPYVPKSSKGPKIDVDAGLSIKKIPESINNKTAPAVNKSHDIFEAWF